MPADAASRRRVLAIVGPTAAGKSALAMALAAVLPAEVVNADSMQLYRGMDVGTAKPSAADRRAVAHHLLDVWDVTRPASVVDYQRLARAAVEDVLARGRLPVLVGGSGLYVRAVLDDLRFPGTDATVRRALEDDLAELGPAALHVRLAAVDPAAAAAILPSNGRRLVRALEVVTITGRPFSARLPDLRPAAGAGVAAGEVTAAGHAWQTVQLGLDRPDLDARIAGRVDAMWAAGLVEEVAGLAAAGLRDGRTAARALGYAQVLRALDGGTGLEQARLDTVAATARFARRQRSWFRRDVRVTWLDADDPQLAARALAALADPPSR